MMDFDFLIVLDTTSGETIRLSAVVASNKGFSEASRYAYIRGYPDFYIVRLSQYQIDNVAEQWAFHKCSMSEETIRLIGKSMCLDPNVVRWVIIQHNYWAFEKSKRAPPFDTDDLE